jgi:hypothetical protein
LEAEARHGFKSTFLFMADPMPSPCWEDGFYHYEDRICFEGRRSTIGDLIGTVVRRGWDVGLHGSCRSHMDAEILLAEKQAVEKATGRPITSTRQHHLLCDVRCTPRVQAEAGFLTDSTFGSNINTEFRCGTCLPFFMYDRVRDEPFPLLQIPLVIQDVPLASNMAGDEELMVRRCTELLDRVADVGGVLTLLWHNSTYPDSVEFRCYQRILDYASARSAWGCSMRELDEWWRSGGRVDG